jgi:hypothetical protein
MPLEAPVTTAKGLVSVVVIGARLPSAALRKQRFRAVVRRSGGDA